MRPPNPLASAVPRSVADGYVRAVRLGLDPITPSINWAFRWYPTSMVDMVSFAVMGPVVPKARARVYRVGGRIRAVTPKGTRSYEEKIRWMGIASVGSVAWKKQGIFALRLTIHSARGHKGDVDNVLKSVMDALEGVLWRDDREVIEAHVYRGSSVDTRKDESLVIDVVRAEGP